MLQNLTLFIVLAKKYENIASISINRYIELCENTIENVFIVCADDVDISKIVIDRKFTYVTDSKAIEILNLNHNEYRCITDDKWMLQQYFKFNCDIITGKDACIIIEVDGLLLKSINHFENDKLNLFYIESKTRAITSTRKVLNFFYNNIHVEHFNFVSENLVFEKKYLIEIRKFLGDFRQYRRYMYDMYDMPLDVYVKHSGPSWPKNPKLTDYKLFHDTSFNNVIFDKLPNFVKEELIKSHRDRSYNLRGNWEFADYEFYSYYLLINYPEKVNIKKLECQVGFIPTNDPTYWINENTPGGREETFLYFIKNTKMKTSPTL